MGEIVYLEISSWQGISFGAVHWYGELKDRNGNLLMELEYPLTESQALARNLVESGIRWHCGDLIRGWDDEVKLIAFAIKNYKQLVPGATILFCGNPAVADPQKVLDGPIEFKESVNALYHEAVEIEFYEKYPQYMDTLYERFSRLLEDVK